MEKFKEIFLIFFKLGIVAFGGPAAHISMFFKEFVEDRKWLDEDHFLDLVGVTALIPGPNSTEMAIHIGHERGGKVGLFTSGAAFIFPAVVLTLITAVIYVELSKLPNFESYILGIKPVVLILIYGALKKLWKKGIKSKPLYIPFIATTVLAFMGVSEVFALLAGALIYFLSTKTFRLNSIDPVSVFFIFFKIGAVLFGSGYVLVAYVQEELITKRGWITFNQLADAIAFGQFTPGPVLSTSTFLGYLLSGYTGAILATVGIFLPSFLFVMFLGPMIPKMRKSENFKIFLDGINSGVIGLMVYAIFTLGKPLLFNWRALVILAISTAIFKKFNLSSIRLIVLGFVLGNLLIFI